MTTARSVYDEFLFGMFPETVARSAEDKQLQILLDLDSRVPGMSLLVSSEMGVKQAYQISRKGPPTEPMRKRGKHEAPMAYVKRKQRFIKTREAMIARYERAKDKAAQHSDIFNAYGAFLEQVELKMTELELTYLFVSCENVMLSQAYTQVMENRKLDDVELHEIFKEYAA